MELIAATGITHSDNIDVDLLLRKIGKTFEPFIITFLPCNFYFFKEILIKLSNFNVILF